MWLQHVEHTWRKRQCGEHCFSQISAHSHMWPTCKHAHIHKPTKSFLNIALFRAFRLAEQFSEWRDHPSTEVLVVQTCNNAVSLHRVKHSSYSCPCASYGKLLRSFSVICNIRGQNIFSVMLIWNYTWYCELQICWRAFYCHNFPVRPVSSDWLSSLAHTQLVSLSTPPL